MAKSLQIHEDKLKDCLDAEEALKSRIDNVKLLSFEVWCCPIVCSYIGYCYVLFNNMLKSYVQHVCTKEYPTRFSNSINFWWIIFEAFWFNLTFFGFAAGIWKRKRKLEAEAVEAVNFLWKRKHFDERGWKRKQTRKRKC